MNQKPDGQTRRPFTPLNTLSSPVKPIFDRSKGTTNDPEPSVVDLGSHDRSVIVLSSPAGPSEGNSSFIGDSSDLFDGNTESSIMADERTPATPARGKEATFKPLGNAGMKAPEFGKPSPLRNPHKKDEYAHMFIPKNPNVSKPFRPPRPVPKAPEAVPPRNAQSNSGQPIPHGRISDDDVMEIPKPANFPSNVPRVGDKNRPFVISQPTKPVFSTVSAAPRPTFSTHSQPSNSFHPINMKGFGGEGIDLSRRDADDRFDPNAALMDNKFGAPDPFMYIDSEKANENIKALLEGAFEDDDEMSKLKFRLRNKKKEAAKLASSLADKMKALELDTEAPEDHAEVEEEDDGAVEGLSVRLLPHQRDGLAWMTDKEIGQRKKNGVLPHGGILADDMGLGKTIQSLALILSNPRPSKAKGNNDQGAETKVPEEVGKGTLVVAPLALIKQWESEVQTKVEPSHALKVLVHHGPSRTKKPEDLKKYDVVVTTYQTLTSEHAGSSDSPSGPKTGCIGVHWYRVILDEAHTIKNRSAKMTKACYTLRSHYRWCLTGTPMQNNLDELQSLICFLQIKPYCDVSPWKDQIIVPMKNGRGGLAMKRLQYFLKAFMKRRTKDILKKDGALNLGSTTQGDSGKDTSFKIVGRHIEVVNCKLDGDERRFYNKLAKKAESRLEEMMRDDEKDYIGALVLLLRLRQACNHPELVSMNFKYDEDALFAGTKFGGNGGSESPQKGQKAVEDDMNDLASMLEGMSVRTKQCNVCTASLSSSEKEQGMVRCEDCDKTYQKVSSQEIAKAKRKSTEKDIKGKEVQELEKKPQVQKSRQARRLIVDSDDEDEDDDGKGDWLVPENERFKADLGKAGGTDDENAEGAGEWIDSEDSESESEDSDVSQSVDSAFEKGSAKTKSNSKEQEIKRRSSSPPNSISNEYDSDSSIRPVTHPKFYHRLYPSTKIRQLIQILERETPKHKVIVFSQFTSMLDLIEPFLEDRNFSYSRYDGKMRNDAREASLHRLRNDPSTRVLICSLKCGSLGLNLTAASRVVILEPFWNPFVEEQAIDRVHRLNQTVDVVVYRLTVSHSVEGRILELQEMKRKLAKAAIESGSKKDLSKLSMKDILGLFSRDAEVGDKFVDKKADKELFGLAGVISKYENDVFEDRYDNREDSSQSQRHISSRTPTWEGTEGPRRKTSKPQPKRTEDPIYGRR